MTAMEGYLENEYERLQEMIGVVLAGYITDDVIKKNSHVFVKEVFKNFLEKQGYAVADSFRIEDKAIASARAEYGLISDSAAPLAFFGVAANQFKESQDYEEKLAALFTMHYALGVVHGIVSFGLTPKINARKGARAKLANDPKQKAKRFVKECWRDWQNNPGNYKSQAKFARDMLDKCPSLENQASVENWCREWKRDCSAS